MWIYEKNMEKEWQQFWLNRKAVRLRLIGRSVSRCTAFLRVSEPVMADEKITTAFTTPSDFSATSWTSFFGIEKTVSKKTAHGSELAKTHEPGFVHRRSSQPIKSSKQDDHSKWKSRPRVTCDMCGAVLPTVKQRQNAAREGGLSDGGACCPAGRRSELERWRKMDAKKERSGHVKKDIWYWCFYLQTWDWWFFQRLVYIHVKIAYDSFCPIDIRLCVCVAFYVVFFGNVKQSLRKHSTYWQRSQCFWKLLRTGRWLEWLTRTQVSHFSAWKKNKAHLTDLRSSTVWDGGVPEHVTFMFWKL